jgi:outer membrane receptor for ferrienterochelin and colicin
VSAYFLPLFLSLLAVPQPESPRTLPDDFAGSGTIETGTPRPSNLDGAPSTITLITRDRLWRSGVRFFPDALRMAPGFEVMRRAATQVNISATGFNDESSAAEGILGPVDGRWWWGTQGR